MDPANFSLFDTPIGPCGLVWGARGLVGVLLPEASTGATRARARRRFGGAVEAEAPPEIRQVMVRVVGLLSGEPDALQDIALDTSALPPFNLRVYDVARGIVPGQTLTYGEVAARIGEPQAARAVGQALGSNPFPIIVPCHRVLAAGGRSGGFSAPGGARTKLRLLEIEGAPLGAGPGLFDSA
ncbi:MAG: methylated-DNA--[protein]-cysteine S-methyltransferase [Burkholderiales bacterium]|nr:methylated-DNA--[protein]-cysteine S-methyltransferase [Burkholderiales bacterium]